MSGRPGVPLWLLLRTGAGLLWWRKCRRAVFITPTARSNLSLAAAQHHCEPKPPLSRWRVPTLQRVLELMEATLAALQAVVAGAGKAQAAMQELFDNTGGSTAFLSLRKLACRPSASPEGQSALGPDTPA